MIALDAEENICFLLTEYEYMKSLPVGFAKVHTTLPNKMSKNRGKKREALWF